MNKAAEADKKSYWGRKAALYLIKDMN